MVLKRKRLCRNCLKEFIPKTKIGFFCCRKCSSHYRGRNLEKLKAINCKNCGELFERKRKYQYFCSIECRYEHYKKNPNEKTIVSSPFLILRFEILKRDNFQCQYCGRNPKQDKCKLRVDHIIPRSKNGTNEVNNLITSCEECNLGKSDILLEENKIKYLKFKQKTQKNER